MPTPTSERQLADIRGKLEVTAQSEREYLERGVTALGLEDLWRRALAPS